MAVALADIDDVHAPRTVFPLTPGVPRCRLLLAVAVATAVGGDLWEVASPYTVATGSPLRHRPAVVVLIGKEGALVVVADLADDNVGPDRSTASVLVGIC